MPLLIGTGLAVAGGVKLYNQYKDAQAEEKKAIQDLKNTDYADYNQAYFEELQKRATMGLPEEQKRYAEIQADRAAGVGLQATEDQRGGLMGIRQTQMGLSDAYRSIALNDAQARVTNQNAYLGELSNRGQMGYQEAQAAGNVDLALAGRKRQETIALANSALQTGANLAGLAPMAFGAPPVPLGGAAPQMQAGGAIQQQPTFSSSPGMYNPAMPTAPPQQYGLGYTPPSGGFSTY
jgi:hypothetical protein